MKLPGARVRNMDKMTSKWSDLNRKMSQFNACFIQKPKPTKWSERGDDHATSHRNVLHNVP
ncbi:hypothetical protein HanXRQr2_Chr05g0196501 [Helianthus annuus]|uniref:Uncharacterized protein n=1 Tax=Helianthus annuus TaxID=4232 RepID=A0A251UM30_HELAN|nr:hypothetical protein HanXRQr2_Chr05g0196501 [Helianthus annuus]KAJ0849537.1 hypothetical protein HanPSC8_Chr13g0569841 [Helianthus annuus]